MMLDKRYRKRCFLLIPAVLLLFFSGCLSDGENVSPKALETIDDRYDESGRLRPIIIDDVIDFSDLRYAQLWNTSPVDGKPRFFATVPRMADREAEYDRCLDMAAVQVSRFVSTRVVAKFATLTQGRDFGHLEDVDVSFDVDAAASFRDSLDPVAYVRDREASYVVFEFSGFSLKGVSVKSGLHNGLPVWVTAVPEIPGYITGLGAVGRYRYVAESIYQADRMAMAGIARQMAIDVKEKQENYEDSKGSTAHRSVNLEVSDIELKGAYIIARWRSLDENNYYALAIYPVSHE